MSRRAGKQDLEAKSKIKIALEANISIDDDSKGKNNWDKFG